MRNVKISASAPRAAKRNAKSAAPVTSTALAVIASAPVASDLPPNVAAETVAKPAAFIPGFIAKRDATINIAAYPAATITGRDESYRAFAGYLFAESPNGFTLGNAFDAAGLLTDNTAIKRRNPFAAPSQASAPATDAGAFTRAIKFGYLVISGKTETGHNIYAPTARCEADASFAIGTAAYAATRA